MACQDVNAVDGRKETNLLNEMSTQPNLKGVKWLHLTDLHVGRGNESQEVALSSLAAAISKASQGIEFDFVFLTGDLAYSGKREEYDKLIELLIKPLRSLPSCASSEFLATPGNHDIDCNVGYPPGWSHLGPKRQEAFFHGDEEGASIREGRAKAFAEYTSFVSRTGVKSVDPTKEVARTFCFEVRGRSICIVSVVTSFFSDKEVSDRHLAPAPVHAIRHQLQQLSEGDTTPIVLGHHPPDWFFGDSDTQLHSLLVEHDALLLHGHEHHVRTRFGARGLLYLGFGAAYLAPLEKATAARYRNSFAICELTDALDIHVQSWDGEHGCWRAEQNLPADFREKSLLLTDGFRLPLPSMKVVEHAATQRNAVMAAMRFEGGIDKCLWLAGDAPKRWSQLLMSIGRIRSCENVYKLPTQTLPAGHCQFRVMDEGGTYLVRGVSASGDILNYEQLQAVNTELDKQAFAGCYVVTLGELADDARTLAKQLSARKALFILERSDIVRSLLRCLPPSLEKALEECDPSTTSTTLLVTDSDFALLLQGRLSSTWFYIVESDGVGAPEASERVQRVRRELPGLQHVLYGLPSESGPRNQTAQVVGAPTFDRVEYLKRNHEYFDEVRYAPLAALGFRFRKTSLSEIYVDASADVGGNTKTTHHLSRAVAEFVGSLKLPKSQQEQLESQLRSKYGLNRSAEVGAARLLYQRYNNVLVLGDPGSGKTCFVKRELIAYCDPLPDGNSWYSGHLPVYVALAEAARLLGEQADLLSVCEMLSARRGIPLPRSVIEQHLNEGRVAFFFDGLDEVGLLEKRIELIAQIDSLMKAHAHRGSRFVLSSRPAAIEPVDVPDLFTYLELKGLTESEIAVLAGRVLTARISDDAQANLSDEEQDLIRRLLDDVKTSPGIARIARNPLLLTLLVLIYANSGALSARRHLVYGQAIKTLVSVRGRETREQQISEADLRSRLGRLALAIFRREIAEIPARADVISLMAPLMSAPKGERTREQAAGSFLQEVAEATGLLAFHSEKGGAASDLVTFMHFSFLEYYAAAGLLRENVHSSLAEYSSNRRWRDVITLLFGIASEHTDITPYLKAVLDGQAPGEEVTKTRLLLAIDCAAECDVPPHQAQELLAEAVFGVVATGSGRFSAELRAELAKRLEAILVSSGATLDEMLDRGLHSDSDVICAAFVDLVAQFGDDVELSKKVCESFSQVFGRNNSVVRASAMAAIERRPELRSPEALDALKRALGAGVVEKHAALKAVGVIPKFQEDCKDELRQLLDDKNAWIAKAAAQCLLTFAMRTGSWKEEVVLVDKALKKIGDATQDTGITLSAISLDPDIWEQIATSESSKDSEMAMRHAHLVHGDDQRVYRVLSKALRGAASSEVKCASLDALRVCKGAAGLVTIADTDVICSMLRERQRNIRLAAAGLLGELPDDEQVVNSLHAYLRSGIDECGGDDEEKTEAARALAKHVGRNNRLRSLVVGDIENLLPRKAEDGFGETKRQQQIVTLLSICESIGGVTNQGFVRRVGALAVDFRTPEVIRRQAFRTFGRMVEPKEESARWLIESLRKDDQRLNDAVYACAASFINLCHRKSDYVRRVLSTLPALREVLRSAWDREVGRAVESIDPPAMVDIRAALLGIEGLLISYEELAERIPLRASD